jgi:plastocyanin
MSARRCGGALVASERPTSLLRSVEASGRGSEKPLGRSPTQRAASAVAAAALALAAGACGSSAGAGVRLTSSVDVHVLVANQMFSPMSVSIPVGGTVTWSFEDGGLPHDVQFSSFHSGAKTAGSFAHTFDAPGSYTYHCSIHPWMTGTVVVTQAERQ